jgi:solute carrier family 13 (sodium-dependent dicarboxylate transporter), member 2/3/5
MTLRSFTSQSKQIGFVAGPVLFVIALFTIPEALISEKSPVVIGLIAWMITWWISEAAPVAITALLPLVIFPATGTMSMAEAAAPFANTSIFLFMGGFMIALALEKHKLHERIALNLITLTGTSGNGVILGFSLATGFLSMWISNTATAIMMLPIAVSVIELLLRQHQQQNQALNKHERNFALGLMLSIGYMASIGGMATVIGTPPNVVFAGFVKQFYNHNLSFGRWMLIGIPVALFIGTSSYLIITRVLFPNQLNEIEGSGELVQTRLKALGSLRKEEKRVLLIFAMTCCGWIFQLPANTLVGSDMLNDTNVAIAGGLLMFLMPTNFRTSQFLLQWEDTQKLPWGILLLFGGGICVAKGMETTGIIKIIGDSIAATSSINSWLLVFILIVATIVLTEFMSNVALVTIFIPVVFAMGNGLGIDPVVLGLPVTFAASCAFMFPISTPPNAIVFASGHVKMKDMIRAGLLLNIASVIIIFMLSWLLLEKINV